MRLYLPSTSMLEAFDAAARTGNFTAAARELSLTQGAVSKQVIALEDQLGTKLFERRRHALVLTETGQVYAQDVRKALDMILAASLRIMTDPGGGRFDLAVLPTFGSRWLIPRLPGFLKAHPGVTVNFVTRLKPFDFRNDRPGDVGPPVVDTAGIDPHRIDPGLSQHQVGQALQLHRAATEDELGFHVDARGRTGAVLLQGFPQGRSVGHTPVGIQEQSRVQRKTVGNVSVSPPGAFEVELKGQFTVIPVGKDFSLVAGQRIQAEQFVSLATVVLCDIGCVYNDAGVDRCGFIVAQPGRIDPAGMDRCEHAQGDQNRNHDEHTQQPQLHDHPIIHHWNGVTESTTPSARCFPRPI